MDFNWQHISVFEGEWGAPHFATPRMQHFLFSAFYTFTEMGGKMHLYSKNSSDKISLSYYPKIYFNRHLKVIRCGSGVFSVCLAILLYGSIQHKHHTGHTKEVEHCCQYKTNWTNVSFLAINPYKSKPAGIPSLAWQKRLTRWKLKISTLLLTGYWTSSHPKSVFDIGSNPFSGSFLTCPINQAQIGFQITFDWISCQ